MNTESPIKSVIYLEIEINKSVIHTTQLDISHPDLEIFEIVGIISNDYYRYEVIIKLSFSEQVTINQAIEELTVNVDDSLDATFDINTLYISTAV